MSGSVCTLELRDVVNRRLTRALPDASTPSMTFAGFLAGLDPAGGPEDTAGVGFARAGLGAADHESQWTMDCTNERHALTGEPRERAERHHQRWRTGFSIRATVHALKSRGIMRARSTPAASSAIILSNSSIPTSVIPPRTTLNRPRLAIVFITTPACS